MKRIYIPKNLVIILSCIKVAQFASVGSKVSYLLQKLHHWF